MWTEEAGFHSPWGLQMGRLHREGVILAER